MKNTNPDNAGLNEKNIEVSAIDVLLFNSPVHNKKIKTGETPLPPLGLYYIATILKESSIGVKVFDCVAHNYIKKEILDIIAEVKPKFVGFNIFSQNYELVKEIVEECSINVSFLIGGQLVKHIYKRLPEWNTNNRIIAIIGEGEYIVKAIVTSSAEEEAFYIEDNLTVYSVNKASIYYPKELSSLKIDRNLLDSPYLINKYGLKEAAMITSRGCIYNCAFCGGARSLNRDATVRISSPNDVRLEISSILAKDSNIECVRILDDLFLRDRVSIQSAIDIFTDFESLQWRAMAHAKTFNNSFDLLNKLKGSGCLELFVGIESGADRVRKRIHKKGSVGEALVTSRKILESGINLKGYFIFGFPDEEICDFEDTYNLAKTIKGISQSTIGDFSISVFEFRPYHGTELYNQIIEKHGTIAPFTQNTNINFDDKRIQFNYHSGNYSQCSSATIDEYI